MNFWRELNDESRDAVRELPPLTHEVVATCEQKFGVKLPAALLDLLHTKNGGFLESTDFKFHGKHYGVREIKGLHEKEDFWAIGTCCFFFDVPESGEAYLSFRRDAADPTRLLVFANNDYYWYAFNYDRLNAAGEPTILGFEFDEDGVRADSVADSFANFLQGQYFGDSEPSVRLEEASRYEVISEGGYDGTLRSTGAQVNVGWKICSHRRRLIIFQRENWGWGETLTRFELRKANLVLAAAALEDYGLDLDPDFAELIRPAVETKSDVVEYDVPMTPRCYQLFLHIQPSKRPWVIETTSEAYEGRWKNKTTEVWHARVYSAEKVALERTLALVVKNCFGKRKKGIGSHL